MDKFQAKDIQIMLNIPKHRYEYLASKIWIKPDIEEVEGRGHNHWYSFKNVLQFAFANRANLLGLSPKASRNMLDWINKFEDVNNLGIYGGENVEISIHYVTFENTKFFYPTGNLPTHVEGVYGSTGLDGADEECSFEKGTLFFKRDKDGTISKDNISNAFKIAMAVTEQSPAEVLAQSEGYVTINIGTIKRRILANIR